jgi:hypothetical protein
MQSFLTDMYTHLTDEVHETLRQTALQEADPLQPFPNIPSRFCSDVDDVPLPFKEYEKKSHLRNLLFYSEEALAQGDLDNAHRLHLQRICISKEDSSCWLDFGTMWLSRGDPRMAEIAFKEAIRKNPNTIYVLIMGGLLSITYNDDRGIDCLNAALSLRPSCPELMVILALAYVQIGNEIASDFFFRRAAYFHRVLTGRSSTAQQDGKLEILSKTVGVRESVQKLDKVEEMIAQQKLMKEDIISNTDTNNSAAEVYPDSNHKGMNTERQNANSSSPLHHERRSSLKRTDHKRDSNVTSYTHRESTARRKGPLLHKGAKPRVPVAAIQASVAFGKTMNKKSIPRPGPEEEGEEGEASQQEKPEQGKPEQRHFFGLDEALFNQRSAADHLKRSAEHPLRFDFANELRTICLADVYLPPFSPSIRIPWNVTEYNEKLKDFLPPVQEPVAEEPRLGSVETAKEIASDVAIKAEYDKLLLDRDSNVDSTTPAGHKIKTEAHRHHSHHMHHKPSAGTNIKQSINLLDIADRREKTKSVPDKHGHGKKHSGHAKHGHGHEKHPVSVATHQDAEHATVSEHTLEDALLDARKNSKLENSTKKVSDTPKPKLPVHDDRLVRSKMIILLFQRGCKKNN